MNDVELMEKAAAEMGLLEGFMKFMNDGGVFMYIILVMWLIGVALAVERFVRLYLYDIDSLFALQTLIQMQVLLLY